jgi:hypothetical protein
MEKKNLVKSLLASLFEKETDIRLKVNIAYSLARIGEKQLPLSLIEEAYKDSSEYFDKSRILLFIGEYGNQETIPALQQMYENDPEMILNIAEAIYEISKNAKVLIFRDKKDRWEITQIPKIYAL